MSASVAPSTRGDERNPEQGTHVFTCVFLSILLFALTMSLRPLAVDGDGAYHSTRAMYKSFLAGVDPKHPLAAALLRAVYLPLQAAGLKRASLVGFTAVSALCAVGTFLLLERIIFPRFIRAWPVSLLCALGVVLSYGVLSRSSTIEVYSPALFLDVALTAYCLRSDFTRSRHVVAASLLLVVAVGFHITNVLIIPFVVALVIGRAPQDRINRTLLWGSATFLLGMAAIVFLLWLGPGRAEWPPDLALILPQRDPQPALGLVGRLSRGAYGFARTVAFLPYIRELRGALAVPYVVVAGGVFLLWAHLARKGFLADPGKNVRLLSMLLLMAAPFIFIGFCYYPSDPERWLFLMPPLWLLIGLAWDQQNPATYRRTVSWDSPILLGAIVLGLGAYNSAALLPDALANRGLAGLKELSMLTSDDDLVISPSGVTGRINEFYLDRLITAENLTLMALVQEHGADLHGTQADLADRIDRALQKGRGVFVFNLIGEGHEKQRGYPWAHMEHDYGPETFLAVLQKYGQDTICSPSRTSVGIIRLRPRQ